MQGAQPTLKSTPDLRRVLDRQMLQQSLRNAAMLHVDVIGPQHTIAQRDIALGVGRTGCAGESALLFGQAFQENWFAMDPRPSLAPTLSLRTRQASYRIAHLLLTMHL